MEIKDCYCLGRVTKPWGVKGQVMLFLDVDEPEDYATLDSAFVEVKGQLVPYFFRMQPEEQQFNGMIVYSGVYEILRCKSIFKARRPAGS